MSDSHVIRSKSRGYIKLAELLGSHIFETCARGTRSDFPVADQLIHLGH
jgi:hypothetical protein